MKKQITIDGYACDSCGATDDYMDACTGCGTAHACHTCQADYGWEVLRHAVYFQGSADGRYCPVCQDDPEVTSGALYRAYKAVESCRKTIRRQNAELDKLRKSAEEHLEEIRSVCP